MFSIDLKSTTMLTLFVFIDMVNVFSFDEVFASILKTYILIVGISV